MEAAHFHPEWEREKNHTEYKMYSIELRENLIETFFYGRDASADADAASTQHM